MWTSRCLLQYMPPRYNIVSIQGERVRAQSWERFLQIYFLQSLKQCLFTLCSQTVKVLLFRPLCIKKIRKKKFTRTHLMKRTSHGEEKENFSIFFSIYSFFDVCRCEWRENLWMVSCCVAICDVYHSVQETTWQAIETKNFWENFRSWNEENWKNFIFASSLNFQLFTSMIHSLKYPSSHCHEVTHRVPYISLNSPRVSFKSFKFSSTFRYTES